MSSVSSVLLVVLLAVAIHSAAPALGQTVQVWSQCSPANFTPGGPYDTNLRGMLKDLVTVAVSYGGYGNDTAGDGAPDQSYGLAICYADAPPAVCRLCLDMAAGNVTLACPRSVSAAMMYNNCLLRYANASFLSRPDMVQRFSFYNNLTRAGDAAVNAATLGWLMDRLAPAAAASLRLFAYGFTNITSGSHSLSLYGFAQCVMDLSPDDCRRCLQRIAASLPIWTRGGRAYSLTCYTRFEVVPFYTPPNTQTIVVAPAPPPPEPSRGAQTAANLRDRLGRRGGVTIRRRLAGAIHAPRHHGARSVNHGVAGVGHVRAWNGVGDLLHR
ncbi:unnamed protein product [Urochloa humidicola]